MALLDNLIHYFKLEADGSDVLGAATPSPTGTPTFTTGKIGNALTLNGTNQAIRYTGLATMDGATSFTYSFWLKPTSIPFVGYQAVWAVGSAGQRTPWIYTVDAAATVTLEFETNSGAADGNLTSAALTAGVWQHLVFTWNGTTVKSYLNGVLNGTTDTTTGNTLANTDGDARFGDLPGLAWFAGQIDEVAMFKNKVLSPLEVSQLYNGGNGLQYPFILGTQKTGQPFQMIKNNTEAVP